MVVVLHRYWCMVQAANALGGCRAMVLCSASKAHPSSCRFRSWAGGRAPRTGARMAGAGKGMSSLSLMSYACIRPCACVIAGSAEVP